MAQDYLNKGEKRATRTPRNGRTTRDGAPKPRSDSTKKPLAAVSRNESKVNPPLRQAKVSDSTHVRAAFLRATGVNPGAGIGDGDANSGTGATSRRTDYIRKTPK